MNILNIYTTVEIPQSCTMPSISFLVYTCSVCVPFICISYRISSRLAIKIPLSRMKQSLCSPVYTWVYCGYISWVLPMISYYCISFHLLFCGEDYMMTRSVWYTWVGVLLMCLGDTGAITHISQWEVNMIQLGACGTLTRASLGIYHFDIKHMPMFALLGCYKNRHQGPLLLTWFNFNFTAWISNYIHYKLWDEITYPFLNFNGCTVEV